MARGAEFRHNAGSVALIAAVIVRAVKMPLDQFAETELFEPLGIRQFSWLKDAKGIPYAASGVRLLPRDMWVAPGCSASKEPRWSAALGNGGQLILVIPERDLVIVVTTGLYDDPRWRSAIGQIPPTIADSLAR